MFFSHGAGPAVDLFPGQGHAEGVQPTFYAFAHRNVDTPEPDEEYCVFGIDAEGR